MRGEEEEEEEEEAELRPGRERRQQTLRGGKPPSSPVKVTRTQTLRRERRRYTVTNIVLG